MGVGGFFMGILKKANPINKIKSNFSDFQDTATDLFGNNKGEEESKKKAKEEEKLAQTYGAGKVIEDAKTKASAKEIAAGEDKPKKDGIMKTILSRLPDALAVGVSRNPGQALMQIQQMRRKAQEAELARKWETSEQERRDKAAMERERYKAGVKAAEGETEYERKMKIEEYRGDVKKDIATEAEKGRNIRTDKLIQGREDVAELKEEGAITRTGMTVAGKKEVAGIKEEGANLRAGARNATMLDIAGIRSNTALQTQAMRTEESREQFNIKTGLTLNAALSKGDVDAETAQRIMTKVQGGDLTQLSPEEWDALGRAQQVDDEDLTKVIARGALGAYNTSLQATMGSDPLAALEAAQNAADVAAASLGLPAPKFEATIDRERIMQDPQLKAQLKKGMMNVQQFIAEGNDPEDIALAVQQNPNMAPEVKRAIILQLNPEAFDGNVVMDEDEEEQGEYNDAYQWTSGGEGQ